METSKLERGLVWTGRMVSLLLSLLFLWSATMKLMAHPSVFEGMSHLGLPVSLVMPLGILELSCVVIYLIPMTSVLGAVLLTGYLGGAILTHLRIGEPVYMQILFGILVWLGLWLREPRLRALLPLRRS
jgi:DoxX-like family